MNKNCPRCLRLWHIPFENNSNLCPICRAEIKFWIQERDWIKGKYFIKDKEKKEEKCENCRYFLNLGLGMCRRRAPTANGGPSWNVEWPQTKQELWCGEWKSG